MVSQMLAAVTSEGAKFVVLKSLVEGEKFWQGQGFQHFKPTMAWFRECAQDVKHLLLSYGRGSAGLPTYVKHLDLADAPESMVQAAALGGLDVGKRMAECLHVAQSARCQSEVLVSVHDSLASTLNEC